MITPKSEKQKYRRRVRDQAARKGLPNPYPRNRNTEGNLGEKWKPLTAHGFTLAEDDELLNRLVKVHAKKG